MDETLMVVGVVLYIILVGFFMYVCVIADPRKSPITRKITIELPQWYYTVCEKWILGTEKTESLATVYNAIFRERNSILQILYLILVLGGWSVMFNYGYAHIPNKYVPGWHRYSGFLVFVVCMITFHMACRSNPGYITAKNIDKFDNYPYDNILYKPNNICPTAKIRKLARSKYDRMTKCNVARFDHYCAWINQSVGEENYKIFLLFLLVQVSMCWYGNVILYYIFKNEIEELQLFQAKFINAKTKMEVDANLWVVTQFLCARHGPMVGHLLLMSVMAVVLTAFLIFHLYLIARGMTTNEFYKWRAIIKRRKRSSSHTNKDALIPSSSISQHRESHSDPILINNNDKNRDFGGNGTQSKYDEVPSDDTPLNNIYNLGVFENFKEVIFPRSLRPLGSRRADIKMCSKSTVCNSSQYDKETTRLKTS